MTRVALAAVGVFIVVVALSRIVSLASIVAAAALPVFAVLLLPDRTPVFLAGVFFVALLVIVKHHANLQRLVAGTENRFGSKKAAGEALTNEKKARA